MTKLYIYVSDPECFLAGDYFLSLRISDNKDFHDGRYPFITEIDVDLQKADAADISNKAVAALDEKAAKLRAQTELECNEIEQRKQKLLSITHQAGAPDEKD
jgi:hypothetical protein